MSVRYTINEESSATFQVDCTDEEGTAVTPTAAWWSLLDEDGAVVNSREEVAFSPLASTMYVDLETADTALSDATAPRRKVLVHYVYTSDRGVGRVHNEEIEFTIVNLLGRPEAS